MPIAQKYNTPAATLYRDRIEAAANGRPLPTELPVLKPGSSASSGVQQGTDPLEGETEAQYVARQRKLQEEVQFVPPLHVLSCNTPHHREGEASPNATTTSLQARERMRQKFGETNGLKSGGKMQGIGSDPNYGSSGGGGTSNVNEGLSTAFTFMTSLVDQVSKTTQDLLQKPASKGDDQSSSSDDRATPSGGSEHNPDNHPWAAIASNAVSFWKQATEVTSDIVNIITKPVDEEEDFKFPRPGGYSTAATAAPLSTSHASIQKVQSASFSTSPTKQSGSSGSLSQQVRNPSVGSLRSDESWDNLDEYNLQEDKDKSPHSVSVNSSSAHTNSGHNSPYVGTESMSRNSSMGDGFSASTTGLYRYIMYLSMPCPHSCKRMYCMFNTLIASTTSSGKLKTAVVKKLEPPVGDDFFATFGV